MFLYNFGQFPCSWTRIWIPDSQMNGDPDPQHCKCRGFIFVLLFRAEQELILDTEDPEGGWVDTHHFADQVRLILCFYLKRQK
jgi:hypothetical protein